MLTTGEYAYLAFDCGAASAVVVIDLSFALRAPVKRTRCLLDISFSKREKCWGRWYILVAVKPTTTFSIVAAKANVKTRLTMYPIKRLISVTRTIR